MDTLIQSQKLKKQADKILRDSKLFEILSIYGEVKIGGAYALDVMLRPDIDLFVVTKKHDWAKVLKVSSNIMSSGYFREFDFVNRVDFEDKDLVSMKGYYFQPWVPLDGVLWKIDIWLITPEFDRTAELTSHYKKLLEAAPEKRKVILELKQAMREGRKYVKGVNGKIIYQAVLENGITNVESFKKFAGILLNQ